MKPYKYISINLHIALEQHDGRMHARIIEPLPTINVDTGARTFADDQENNRNTRRGETVIILDG